MKRLSGHNLLEAILATFIFATAVIFLTGLWATYHEALTKNKNRMIAMAVARSELESRIALGYSNLIPLFSSAANPTKYVHDYSFDSWIRGRTVNLPLKAEFWVIELAPLGFPRLAHLYVTVRWYDKTGPAAVPGTFGNMSVTYDSHIFDGH